MGQKTATKRSRYTAWALAVLLTASPAAIAAGAGRDLAGAVGLTLTQKWRLLGITREANRLYPSGKWPKFRESDFSGASLSRSALHGIFERRIRYRTAALSRIMYVNKRFYGNLDPEQKARLVAELKRDAARKNAKRRALVHYERRWFRVTYDRMGVPAEKRPALEAARIRMVRLRARSFAAGGRHAGQILAAIKSGRPIDGDLDRMNREMRTHEIRVARAKMHLLYLFNGRERRAVLADFTNMMNKRNL